MREYYFLASYLPEIQIGHIPALGFAELMELIKVNVSTEDKKAVKELLRQIDYENFRAFFANEPLDPRGNLNKEEIEKLLTMHVLPDDEEVPEFLIDFLEKYPSNVERLLHFQILLSAFYDDEVERNEGFIKEYYQFQKQWRLVILAYRAKRLGLDLSKQLQYEDVTDPFVAQLLAQKDAKVYEPPFEYKDVKPVFEMHYDNPSLLHKSLYEYQFNQMIELWGGAIFTIDRILNYMARLILVEKYNEMGMSQGIAVIDQIEGNIQ